MTQELVLPALYKSADKLSSDSQKEYLNTLRMEYSLLIVCSAMSINQVSFSAYYYLYTFLFVLALASFVWRFMQKPERTWYQGRALAESVKTSAWRFAMKAAPFDDTNDANDIADFRRRLQGVISANKFAGEKLSDEFAAEEQVTKSMLEWRNLDLPSRINLYDQYRILDQRNWYARKSRLNKIVGRRWVASCILIYALAIISSLTRANYPSITWAPTELLITVASSIVGWIQIKRYTELRSSYALTAHEIGLIHSDLTTIKEETEFSKFVNEAEQAFSREHTQWVARLVR